MSNKLLIMKEIFLILGIVSSIGTTIYTSYQYNQKLEQISSTITQNFDLYDKKFNAIKKSISLISQQNVELSTKTKENLAQIQQNLNNSAVEKLIAKNSHIVYSQPQFSISNNLIVKIVVTLLVCGAASYGYFYIFLPWYTNINKNISYFGKFFDFGDKNDKGKPFKFDGSSDSDSTKYLPTDFFNSNDIQNALIPFNATSNVSNQNSLILNETNILDQFSKVEYIQNIPGTDSIGIVAKLHDGQEGGILISSSIQDSCNALETIFEAAGQTTQRQLDAKLDLENVMLYAEHIDAITEAANKIDDILNIF